MFVTALKIEVGIDETGDVCAEIFGDITSDEGKELITDFLRELADYIESGDDTMEFMQ